MLSSAVWTGLTPLRAVRLGIGIALAAVLLLAGCATGPSVAAPPIAPPTTPSLVVTTVVPPPTATPTPAPADTATPVTSSTPNVAATTTAAVAATRGAAEAHAVDHLGAGNTLLQANNLPGAVHEYQTAQANAPWRADVRSAVGTAQALVATATAQAAPPVLPQRLLIPSLGVNAPVEYVGLTSDGAMEAPQGWWDAGWYRYGPAPGQVGNAVIAGHLDSTTGPAVFWRLASLDPGATVLVAMTNGSTLTFTVQERESYGYNDAPLDRIFGPAATANLNLITCSGIWNAQQHNYSNRTVIYARES